MSTKTSQRVGIWIIAAVFVVSTIGLFIAMVLQPQNDAAEQARVQQQLEDYNKAAEEAQTKQAAQTAELSAKYYPELSQYTSRVSPFDAASVTELKTEDLKVGDGDELNENSSFTAYYIGWKPDGTVFDQSIEGESLKQAFQVTPGSVIVGWTEGVKGMKVGGVRELTIPAAKAYGEAGSGESIPPNTPLKFVIMVIPTPEVIAQPEFSEELLRALQRQQG